MKIDAFKIILDLIPVLLSLIPILLIFGAIYLLILKIKNKVHVKYRTFKGRGFKLSRGNFGLYCYCGAQGKGKTYSLVEYLVDNNDHIKVFSNILDIKNVSDITYYRGFTGLMKIKEALDKNEIVVPPKKQLIIIFDEVFTEIQKNSKLGPEVMDFLCQMRKRKIIFLTTAQYWAELNITYRRFCRYQIDCNMIPILWSGILIKTFHDAEQMKWSNDDQDFVAPITETSITKIRKKIADSYDTMQRITTKKEA